MKNVRKNEAKRISLRKFGILLFVVAATFVMFQIVSVSVISKSAENQKTVSSNSKGGIDPSNSIGGIDPLGLDLLGNPKILKVMEYLKKDKLTFSSNDKDIVQKTQEVQDDGSQQRGPRGVRGVLLKDTYLYQGDSSDMFHCLKSKKKISMAKLNNNYCDCDDFSDEPGTSACPNSRFYCKYQLPTKDTNRELWVIGSRVNDGICDCCDGSDEWRYVTLPPDLRLKDTSNHGAKQSPCVNNCDRLLQEQKNQENIVNLGNKARKSYIDFAKQHGMQNNNEFGPDGVFYKVSQTCKELKIREFVYIICPFGTAKQSSFGTEHVIGRRGTWKTWTKSHDFQLLMDNGDSVQCPENIPRTTTIIFQCGLEEKIISIGEDERCHYLVNWSSPAACEGQYL